MRICLVTNKIQAMRVLTLNPDLDAVLQRTDNDLSVMMMILYGRPFTHNLLTLPACISWRIKLSPCRHYAAPIVGGLIRVEIKIGEILPHSEQVEYRVYDDFVYT